MANADVFNTTVKSRYYTAVDNDSRLISVMASKHVNLRVDFDVNGNLIGVQWRKEGKEWNKA